MTDTHQTASSAAGERLISLKDLKGAVAYWACWQHPYHAPEGLFEFLPELKAVFDKPDVDIHDFTVQWFDSKRAIEKAMEPLLTHPAMMAWNTPRNGTKAPFVFSSRYDQPSPESDIIDTYALIRNAAGAAWDTARKKQESRFLALIEESKS